MGRIGKWATEINYYVIDFVDWNTIKSQALTDFVADWTPNNHSMAEATEPIRTVQTDGA
jgi:hypothetical protein